MASDCTGLGTHSCHSPTYTHTLLLGETVCCRVWGLSVSASQSSSLGHRTAEMQDSLCPLAYACNGYMSVCVFGTPSPSQNLREDAQVTYDKKLQYRTNARDMRLIVGMCVSVCVCPCVCHTHIQQAAPLYDTRSRRRVRTHAPTSAPPRV